MYFRFFAVLLILFLCMKISTAQSPAVLQSPAPAYQSFQQGETFYLRGEYQQAIPYLAKAEKAYGSNYNAKVIANALHSLALLQSGKKEAAYFSFYKVGEAIVDTQTNIKADAKVALNYCISRYHWSYNERKEALSLLKKVKKSIADPKTTLPTALTVEVNQYLGEVENSKGNYEAALEYYQKAIATAEKLPMEQRNQETFSEDNLIIGELQEKLIEPDSALQVYKHILEQKEKIIPDDPKKEIELSFRLGNIYFKQKQYELALPYLKNTIAAIESYGLNQERLPSTEAMVATIYADKRSYKTAAEFNTPALSIWKEQLSSSPISETFDSYLKQGLIYRKIEPEQGGMTWYTPTAFADEQDWKQALAKFSTAPVSPILQPEKKIDYNLGLVNYEKANQLVKKFPKSQQPIKEIEVAMAKGALFFEAEDFDRAKQYYQRAMDLMEPIYPEKHPLVAEASRMLGECLIAEKEFALALGFMDRSINASMVAGNEISGNAVPDVSKTKFPFELLNALSSKGVALSGVDGKVAENLQLILENYAAAIQLLQKLRKTHRNEGAKYRLSSTTHKFCQQAVLTAHGLWELTQDKKYLSEAFKYAELSKSAVLLESLRDLKARKVNGIPPEIIEKENQLKVDIAYLKSEVFYELKQGENKDEARVIELEESIQDKTLEHDHLLEQLEAEYPDYYQMKYDYSLQSLEDLQAGLQPNEAFLEYVATDSFVYALAITKDNVYPQYTSLPFSLSSTVKKLQRAIRYNNHRVYFNLGYQIYEAVWSNNFSQKLQSKKLIIAPDAELSYIPFGVLPTQPNTNVELNSDLYPNTTFLIELHPISYSYSANLFLLNKDKKTSSIAKQKLLTLAPNFEAVLPVLKTKLQLDTLEELPGAIEEAQYIAGLFDGDSKTQAAASELLFKQKAPLFDVIHIATHGILDDNDPLFSNLVLAPEGEEDGFLHTYELFNMQIEAEMAVLSACNSGSGKLTRGEGVISIARGFAYAGVPNIVMSKWQVSDFTTKIIMGNFYQNLGSGLPKDEAMQLAKINFLEDYATNKKALAPFYWGAFVVVGNNNPVPALIQTNSNWIWITVGLVIFLIATLGIIFWKRNQS